MVKNPSAIRETCVQSLGWEDPLEEGLATHSRILAWRIPWTEESGGLYYLQDREESDTTKRLSTIYLWALFPESIFSFVLNSSLSTAHDEAMLIPDCYSRVLELVTPTSQMWLVCSHCPIVTHIPPSLTTLLQHEELQLLSEGWLLCQINKKIPYKLWTPLTKWDKSGTPMTLVRPTHAVWPSEQSWENWTLFLRHTSLAMCLSRLPATLFPNFSL